MLIFVCFALNGLGLVAEATGALGTAERYFQESLATAKEWGKGYAIIDALRSLANAHVAQGKHELAKKLYHQALETMPENDRRQGEVLAGLGLIAFQYGDYAEAQRLHEESLSLNQSYGLREQVLRNYNELGKVAMTQGRNLQSRQHFEAALREGVAIGAAPLTLDSIAGLAELLAQEGDAEEAARLALLIIDHPASWARTRERSTRLVAQLERELSAEAFVAIRRQAMQSDLAAVAAALLAQLTAAEGNG